MFIQEYIVQHSSGVLLAHHDHCCVFGQLPATIGSRLVSELRQYGIIIPLEYHCWSERYRQYVHIIHQ